jgi:dephospho-CoA kinase
MKRILLIGITGNFGSGKSTVSQTIEQLGYPVIYSDQLAKELMKSNESVKRKIIQAFGKDAFLPDGNLNTKWLSEKVFATSEEAEQNLARLNSIVHPFVLDETEKIINNLISEGKDLIFFESALIFEAGIEELFDYILLVYADKDKVIERLTSSGKFTKEEIERRLARQIAPDEKKKQADFVIYNNGTIEELENNVRFILEMIKELQGIDNKSKNNT